MTARTAFRSTALLAFLTASALLSLSLGGSAAGIVAEPPGVPRFSVLVKDSARQGDPLFVSLLGEPGGSAADASGLSVRLVFADGSEGPRAPVFPMPRRSRAPGSAIGEAILGYGPSARDTAPYSPAWLAFAGIPIHAAPGTARILIESGTLPVAEAAIRIEARGFRKEDIRLDDSLTSLRADPDPLKTAQAERYQALLASVDPAAVYLDGGFVRPVDGDRRTSLFGDRRRYLYSTGGTAFSDHAGVDYGYPRGTPVVAAGRGRVVMAEERIVTGLTVVIEHLPGAYTVYMHMSRLDVAVGAMVERGESIGAVGATGLATGPHLHWELRIGGVACDPEALIGIDKVPDIRTIGPAIEGR